MNNQKQKSMRISGLLILLLLLTSCNDTKKKPEHIQADNLLIDQDIQEADTIKTVIEPYKSKIKQEMNRQLCYAPKAMYKTDFELNTPIGNLMADAVLLKSNFIFQKKYQNKVDAALLNYGGIRAGINKGDVMVRTAYNIMPFENEVVVAELKASTVKQMIDYLVKAKKAHPIAGMQIQLDKQGNLTSAKINNESIQDNKTYFIATSDYLFNGGDAMNFFSEAKESYHLNYKLRNLFIDYFEEKDTLKAKHDNRFIQN